MQATTATLNGLEREVVELFVQLVSLLKLPRSIGELYGVLFIAPEPLPMEDLIRRLRLSKGSASQGLTLLRSIGAVRTVYVPGDRRNHYVAETELRRLAAGFMKEQVAPHFEQGRDRLERIDRELAHLPAVTRHTVERRIDKLHTWQKQAGRIMPVLLKLIRA